MKTLQGYIFSRDFMGERAPQHVQNIVIRDYCIKNDFKYVLSATEYAMAGSDLMLKQIVQNFSSIDGVVAYSVFQMPEERQKRHKIIELTLAANKELHFAVESMKIFDQDSANRVEMLWLVKQHAQKWLNQC